MDRRSTPVLVACQGVAGLLALATLACWPPQRGAMLLVPLPGSDARAPIEAALEAGAALLGQGSVAGSVVVNGDLAALRVSTAGMRVLVMAAPPAGCGTPAGNRA